MIIENFKAYIGESCEPTTVGNLLQYKGLYLSEPMLFGIGEGLNFIYWDSKQMGFPFLGGRCKQDVLTQNIVNNLHLNMIVNETSSKTKAWEFVRSNIDNNVPVGLKLDSYFLDYFTEKIHFAAHYVTIYGYDDQFGYLIDTKQQGIKVKSALSSLADARNARGPMSSRNRAFTISRFEEMMDIKNVIIKAIYKNAEAYLNPPIQNASYKGIRKAANLIGKWFERTDLSGESIARVGLLMEKAGTGGALFRNMYRDFLRESVTLYPELNLQEAVEDFERIAPMWSEVAGLITEAGNKSDFTKINKASMILMDIAALEERAMGQLYKNTSNLM